METFNNNIQNFFRKQKQYFKNHKKRILINYIVFFSVFVAFLLFDILTKHYLFYFHDGSRFWDGTQEGLKGLYEESGTVTYESLLIGIRSVGHIGVTFIPGNSPTFITIIQTLGIVLFLILLISIPYMTSPWFVVAAAIIAAGDMGNTIDRFVWDGMVKDIWYTPWLKTYFNRDPGTFNSADIFIFTGASLFILSSIISVIFDFTKKNKNKEIEDAAHNQFKSNSYEDEDDRSNNNNNFKMS